jgi:hypothetical protein
MICIYTIIIIISSSSTQKAEKKYRVSAIARPELFIGNKAAASKPTRSI